VTAPRYREKAASVEAMQWTGENSGEVVEWAVGGWQPKAIWIRQAYAGPDEIECSLVLPGNQGEANVGDWIIKDGDTLSVCGPTDFAELFEPVEEAA